MSPTMFVYDAIKNCKAHLGANYSGRYGMLKRTDNPSAIGYDPEMDISPELSPNAASYFHSIIFILEC